MLGQSVLQKRRIISQIKKYISVYREEGKSGIVWSIKDFSHKVRKSIFSIEKYYLYKMDLNNEIPIIKAKIDNLRVKPLFVPISLQDYEFLGNEGVDFERLAGAEIFKKEIHKNKRGTIVFLTYKDDILMNRTGMTLYNNGVYQYVYPKSLDDGKTVYAGFSETKKEARRKGIYSFVHSYAYNFLKKMGFKKVILLESEEQVGPRKVQDRLNAKVIYNVYCIRILILFNFWSIHF